MKVCYDGFGKAAQHRYAPFIMDTLPRQESILLWAMTFDSGLILNIGDSGHIV